MREEMQAACGMAVIALAGAISLRAMTQLAPIPGRPSVAAPSY